MNRTKEVIFTEQSELEECLDYWQEILGLQKWNITIRFARATESDMADSQGRIRFNNEGLDAGIKILRKEDWDFEDFVFDMEKVIVHELLHISFGQFYNEDIDPDEDPKGALEAKLMHQTIESLARSFVDIKRKAENDATDRIDCSECAYKDYIDEHVMGKPKNITGGR